MKFEIEVKKKQFKDSKTGEIKSYYAMLLEMQGQTIKLRADEKEKKLLNYFLDQYDIPLEREDKKEALMRKLLEGEQLSAEEKAILQNLLLDDEEG